MNADRDDFEKRLDALKARVASAQREEAKEPDRTRGVAGMAQAFRLSSEFIAGILVGAGLGWAIDYFAGTGPWGLIIFLLLGFGAGILNVLRATDPAYVDKFGLGPDRQPEHTTDGADAASNERRK
ncbi:MAG: AtpZ/AtpI family protein [Rhodobiaceae bacterium]|nr:AtpZ/AtpI family protein [Rhodobiaceae bacterium]